jgi:hypothetical protein
MTYVISRTYGSAAAAAGVVKELRLLGLRRSHVTSETTADGNQVSATAPFGTAADIIDIMEGANPLEAGRVNPPYEMERYNSGAPLSELIGIPAVAGEGDMFSRFLGFPVLSDRGPLPDKLVIRQGNGAYKGLFGLPLVSRQSGSYKGLFGLPLLTKTARGPRAGARPCAAIASLHFWSSAA